MPLNATPLPVSIDHPGFFDAFGRQRVAEPTALFASQLQYNLAPLLWQTKVAGTGAVTHLPNQAAASMSTGGTASGASVIRQTYQYLRYQPGKAQQPTLTAVLGAAATNVRRRVGYFDAQNGIFLEQTSAGLFFVVRSYATGEAVDTRVAQSAWSGDRMDGTGDSGITLDPTKAQIIAFDMEWLGVGGIACGFVVDNEFRLAHLFRHANILATVYMTTANLPLRYEIANTGAAGATATMLQICNDVISSGGFEAEGGYPFSAGNGATGISVSTRRPVASIAPKLTFNSIVNRGTILPESVEIFATTKDVYWEMVYGGALTDASYASASDNSLTNVDVAASAISGGIRIASGYIAAGGTGSGGRDTSGATVLSRLPLTLDIDGANPIPLSIVATGIGGTAVVYAAINWRELY